MARLFTSTISGAGTVAATGFSASGSAAAMATAPTGGTAIQIDCSDSASTRLIRKTITMPRGVDYFCKLLVEINTAPTSAIDLCSISNGSTVWRLRWTTSRTLQLIDGGGATLATSAAITVNTLATIEVSWRTQTTTTGLWTFRLNGTQVGTGSTANLGSIDNTEFVCGKNVSTRAGFILYVCPEFGVNDSTGGVQDSWVSFTADFVIDFDAVGNATLGLTAPTQLPLARSDGVGNATATLTGPVSLPLARIDGVSSPTLRATAATQVPLVRVDAIGNATLALAGSTQVPLARVDAVSNATLGLTAATSLPLARVDAVGGNSLALTTGVASNYAIEVNSDSPSAYFRYGESSGTAARDEVGGASGTYTSTFTLAQRSLLPAETDTSVLLGGGYITAADRVAFDLGDVFTLEAWIYPTAYRGRDGLSSAFIDKGTNAYIMRFADAGDGTFILRRNGVSTLVTSTARIPLNAASHVVATKNGATVKLYLNGRDVTGTVTNATMTDNTNAFVVGAADGGTDNFFVGNIDEVAVYPTALSAARVIAHYNAGTGVPSIEVDTDGVSNATLRLTAPTQVPLARVDGTGGNSLALSGPVALPLGRAAGIGNAALTLTGPISLPLSRIDGASSTTCGLTSRISTYVDEVRADTPTAWYRLGEASGTAAVDAVGGASATYTGTLTLRQPSLLPAEAANTSVLLGGGYIIAADRAAFDFGVTFTLECWIKPTSYLGTDGFAGCFIDKGSGAYIFRFADARDGRIILRANDVGTMTTSTAIVPLNVSSHLVVTKSGATVHMYLDGREVTGIVTSFNTVDNALPFVMGAADGGVSNFFQGTMDEVAVYNYVLAPDRVLAHYDAGNPGDAPIDNLDVDGVSNATLRLTAATRLPLTRVDGASEATLLLDAGGGVSLPLSRASGVSNSTLRFTVGGPADITPRTITGIGQPTLEIDTPGFIAPSSLSIGIETPADWTSMATLMLAATNAPYARMDWTRMQTLAGANAAFSAVRAQGAFVIVMFPNGTSASTITSFCTAHAMGANDCVELGNEDSYSYKTTTANLPSVAQAHANYAAGVRNAFTTSGIRCQLICQGDPAMRGTTWINNLYIAQPNLHNIVSGFSVHPYGPPNGGSGYDGYHARLNDMINQLVSHGAPRTVPIYITEYGISSDDGPSLIPDNYGWPVNLTYAQQSANLITVIRDIKANYRSVKIMDIFQGIDQAVHLADTDREHYFGVLKRDGSQKPVAAAIRAEVEATGATPPTAGLLDDFNRANGALGANWTTMIGTAPEIAANFVRPAADGAGPSGAFWNPTRWADAEAYVKMSQVGEVRVYARMTAANGNGYRVRYDIANSLVSIARVDAGVGTDLATFTSVTLAAGDSLGIVTEGSLISAWRRVGTGSWTFVGSIADTTYSAAGYIGFVEQNSNVRVDDFGGGALASSSVASLTPRTVPGLGLATLDLTTGTTGVPAPISGTAVAVGNATLRMTVATGITFSNVSGSSTTRFIFSSLGRPAVDPETVQGQSDLQIDFTVVGATQVDLGPIDGVSSATLALRLPPASATRRAVLLAREYPPLWLAAVATPPGSRARTRWAGDEPNIANAPSDITISSSVPGGFDSASAVLPRRAAGGYPDLERMTDLVFYGAGGRVAWEGRLNEAPAVSGDQVNISPSAVGYKAHLEDDTSASMVFIDRDLSRWQGPSAQRRLNLINASVPHQSDASASWDNGANSPGLVFSLQGSWSGVTPRVEAWYDGGPGNRVARVRGDFVGWSDANFQLFSTAASDAVSTVQEQTGDLYGGIAGSFDFSPVNKFRYHRVQWHYFTQPAGVDGTSYALKMTFVFVLGDHALVLRTDPVTAFKGFFASDIAGFAVNRWAPLLRTSSSSIQTTNWVIPHCAYYEAGNVASMLDDVTRYGLEDWGVWDRRTFYLYRRGTVGRRWRARVAQARLKETGPTSERLWNGVIVRFPDTDGTTRTVGPPGSGCDYTSSLLHDSDPTNPANKLGINRYAPPLETPNVSVVGAATQVGAQFLAEMKALDRSGSAELVGVVEDEAGRLHPAWAVRGGDTISFTDAHDTSYRRIVRASYNENSLTTSIDLDAPPDGMAAILARLGLVVAGVN